MNLNNNVVKGAIMILLASILSITTNFPETGQGWLIFSLSTLGTMLVYFGQSALFHSTSETGQLNGSDILKALLVSFGNGLSTYLSQLGVGEPIHWKALIISMIGMFAGYLIKQWQTPSPKA
jgi:hypothetical protein